MLVGLTQFIGLACYVPFSNWHDEVKDLGTLKKIFFISLTATATFLCLGYGLQYLPITSSIIIRMGGQTFFTVLGCYMMGRVPLTAWMVVAMSIVVAGVVLSCAPLFDEGGLGAAPSLQVLLPGGNI